MKANQSISIVKKIIKQFSIIVKIIFLKIVCEKVTKKKLFEIDEIRNLL